MREIPKTFENELETFYTDLGTLDVKITSIESVLGDMEEVQRLLTPEVVKKIDQTTNMLSEVAIENLARQAEIQNELVAIQPIISSADRALNETMTKMKFLHDYVFGTYELDEPMDLSEDGLGNFNHLNRRRKTEKIKIDDSIHKYHKDQLAVRGNK